MLEGKRFGPFRIERLLGSGAMGSVYLAIYEKNKKKVAIKVMAPGLVDSPSALKRFERETQILTQLDHPNIVKMIGTGKKNDYRYYFMEYLRGESLDHVMARRGRMTWEEVLDIGQQLCSALDHAHKKGVIHRDLKPSNLIVTPDGTLKLTDFGIAKDVDVTQITEANCTVGTAAYMSPEQCRGERDITYKSDLYSLGIVLYELICGRKPFNADNAMAMFILHVEGKFERPSRIVLDLPVWLDNLICQLLEKKPDQRPLDAGIVADSLEKIREKVQTMQSAGVSVARARHIDRVRNKQLILDEADRRAARLLTGRKERKKVSDPFYRSLWFVMPACLAVLLGTGWLFYLLTRPPTPTQLFARAEKLMKSSNPEDWEKARDGPIATYRQYYRNLPGEMTDQMELWGGAMARYEREELLRRFLRKSDHLRPAMLKDASDATKAAFAVGELENDGNLIQANEAWRKIADQFGPESAEPVWGEVAEEHLKMLAGIHQMLLHLRKEFDDSLLDGIAPVITGGESAREMYLALRYQWFGDPLMSQEKLADLRKKWHEIPSERLWFLFAAFQEREIKQFLKNNPSEDRTRLDKIRAKLTEAQKQPRSTPSRVIAQTILDLYSQEEAMAGVCKDAKQLLQMR